MRDQEHERRAAESNEQREDRLQRVRESRQGHTVDSQDAILDQPTVRTKMLKFHRSISNIEVPLCLTCLESFPGLSVSSDECNRCHRDDSTPKLYSDANNMDPGEVPPQLQVIMLLLFMIIFTLSIFIMLL